MELALVSGGGMALIEIVANVIPIVTEDVGPEPLRDVWVLLASYSWINESAFYRSFLGDDARYLVTEDNSSIDLDPQRAVQLLLTLLRDGLPE